MIASAWGQSHHQLVCLQSTVPRIQGRFGTVTGLCGAQSWPVGKADGKIPLSHDIFVPLVLKQDKIGEVSSGSRGTLLK